MKMIKKKSKKGWKLNSGVEEKNKGCCQCLLEIDKNKKD